MLKEFTVEYKTLIHYTYMCCLLDWTSKVGKDFAWHNYENSV